MHLSRSCFSFLCISQACTLQGRVFHRACISEVYISWAGASPRVCASHGRVSFAGMHLKSLYLIGAYISQDVYLRCVYLMGGALSRACIAVPIVSPDTSRVKVGYYDRKCKFNFSNHKLLIATYTCFWIT